MKKSRERLEEESIMKYGVRMKQSSGHQNQVGA